MTRTRRANGAGSVYTKHGSFYGRWTTEGGGHPNRLLGPVRLPGSATGLTRKQAERRLRELMDEVQVATAVELTVSMAGQALLEQLEAKGRAKSHVQTVESHLRVHIEPFFKEKPIDRVTQSDVTRFLVALRRKELMPKTSRNVLSTLHSLFELALRRRWVSANPCKLVDAPVVEHSGEIRFLKQAELMAVLEGGVPDDALGTLERPLYLMAAMTGLRQGELLALRWLDLDGRARKVRVRPAFVRGEFKSPKSRRGHAAFRWPMSWTPRWTNSVKPRCSPRTTISCSRIRPRANRWIGRRSTSDSRGPAGAPACASSASTTFGTLSHPHRRFRRGLAAHAAGVDGPPRRQDDVDLRRLPAGRARVRDRQRRVPLSR